MPNLRISLIRNRVQQLKAGLGRFDGTAVLGRDVARGDRRFALAYPVNVRMARIA
jgi:hypothetical protein